MNERIRELAEQAKAFIIESEHAKIGEVSEVSFDKYSDLEKFAELIVKECMNICEQQRLKILNNPNDPSWTEHLAECQTTIEQTFLRS